MQPSAEIVHARGIGSEAIFSDEHVGRIFSFPRGRFGLHSGQQLLCGFALRLYSQ